MGKVKEMCRERGITVKQMLEKAGVSRNAFYTLARKKSIIPRSISAIANDFNIRPSELIEDGPSVVEEHLLLFQKADLIASRNEGADRDNVLHALQLLREEPVTRLRRALTRAQRFNFQ